MSFNVKIENGLWPGGAGCCFCWCRWGRWAYTFNKKILSATKVYSDTFRGEFFLQLHPYINIQSAGCDSGWSLTIFPKVRVEFFAVDSISPCFKNGLTPCAPCPEKGEADPLNPLTGNFFKKDTDYSLAGRGLNVEFARSYGNLDNYAEGYPDSMLWRRPLGRGWTHSYNLFLDPQWLDTLGTWSFVTKWDTVIYNDENGNEWLYMKSSSDTLYKSEFGNHNLLKRKAGRFTLYRTDGNKVLFNSSGRADTLIDRNGNKISLSYDANNNLSKITDTRNRAIYLSYYPGTKRLRRLYEAPDSTNGRYYEYRYGITRANQWDTIPPPQWRYQLFQVLKHYPTGGADSLIVMHRYYYDHANNMVVKVLPTGQFGAENDTTYATNRKRGDRINCWYGKRHGTDSWRNEVVYQEVVQGDGDTILSNDRVLYKANISYFKNSSGAPESTQVYYHEGPISIGSRDPLVDSLLPLPMSNYYVKTIFFSTNTAKFGMTLKEIVFHPATGEKDTTLYSNYDRDFNIQSIKDPLGAVTNYTFQTYTDHLGVLRYLSIPTKIKYGSGDSVLYWYSVKAGNPRFFLPDSTKDEENKRTHFYYDAYGNNTAIVYKSRVLSDSTNSGAQDVITKFRYNKGNLTRVIDAKGNSTYFNYAPNDTGAYLTRTWIDMDNKGTVSNPDIVTRYWYDTNRGLLDSLGYYQDFTTTATPIKVRYKYDALNNLFKVTYPDTSIDSLIYDKRGNLLQKFAVKSGIKYFRTDYSYDAMDKLLSVSEYRDPDAFLEPPYVTRYSYNLHGDMDSLSNANDETPGPIGMINTTISYNYALGRLRRVNYADGTTDSLWYYANGLLKGKKDRNSQRIEYFYDNGCGTCGRGRLTKKVYYDSLGVKQDSVRFSYDKVGNMTKVIWRADSTLYTYDDLYRMKSDSQAGINRKVLYQYDKNGNRQRMRVTKGDDTTRIFLYQSYPEWDRANRDSTTAVRIGNNTWTWSFIYYDTGPLKRIVYPQGSNTVERYNLTSRNFISSIIDSISSLPKFRNIYAYNPLGDRISDSLKITKPNGSTTEGRINWSYDGIRRLTATRYPSSINNGDSSIYTYDPVGNRNSKTSSGSTNNYSYNIQNNELTSEGSNSYSYDKNGNLIQKSPPIEDFWNYWYDFENRLTKVKQQMTNDSVMYEYSGTGERTRKLEMADTTRYTYDGLFPVLEYRNDGSKKQSFIYANGLLLGIVDSTVTVNKRYYVLHDGLGSSVSLTDSAGNIKRSLVYSDFGEALVDTSASGIPTLNRLYAGYSWDATPTDFYWMKYRQTYDAVIGRFGTEDPAVANVAYPQTLNKYLYTLNNSTNFVDPLGLFCIPWFPTGWRYSPESWKWELTGTSPLIYVNIGYLRIYCYWDRVESGIRTRTRLCCECWKCWIQEKGEERASYKRTIRKAITRGFAYPYGPGHQYIPICDKPYE